MSQFATFWKGPRLTAFEASCLHSFVAAGHDVTLFCYDEVQNVPSGVQIVDAATIADEAKMSGFLINGVPSVSHFSDYFRYVMFSKTKLTWVDTDVLLLRSWDQDPATNLLALETSRSICNAVMRIDSLEPWLPKLVAEAEELMHTQMRWGETGPRLITKLVGAQVAMEQAQPVHLYFPVHFDEFWKVFLPEHAETCAALCSKARTLHLWNNIVDRLGFWKEYLPPAGSYLHSALIERGCQEYFRGEFPLKNMRQLIENWQARQTGDQLGIRSVVRQLVPSIHRTFKHYAG